ncbi:MAG: CarD family transcriptional regulator [Chloroflexota bacterium]
MFNTGDTIVHSRYGAGKVVGKKTITLDGEERHYICIELSAGRGTLMVQPEEVNPEEVRETMDDMSLIREVFAKTPQELSDQHRSRQPKLQAKLRSNNPKKIAEALRDLMWREATNGLTETDRRIMMEARQKIIQELKISDEITEGTRKLDEMTQKAIVKHVEKSDLTAAV